MKIKDIMIRAGKTFIQAAGASLIIAFQSGIDVTNKDVLYSVLAGSIAAGLSAVMNFVSNYLKIKKEV